jgi:hypothetical protein
VARQANGKKEQQEANWSKLTRNKADKELWVRQNKAADEEMQRKKDDRFSAVGAKKASAAQMREDKVKAAKLKTDEAERKRLTKMAGSDKEGAGQGDKICSKIRNMANVA